MHAVLENDAADDDGEGDADVAHCAERGGRGGDVGLGDEGLDCDVRWVELWGR